MNEPKWKSLLANTVGPLFTPEQCNDIIQMGRQQPAEKAMVRNKKATGGSYDTKMRITTISWIPFKAMPQMYLMIERSMNQVNRNHFGYEGMKLTEPEQFTEYPKGGFYDWHMDNDVTGKHQPPVRKISMTLLLSDPSTFEGGDLEIMSKGKTAKLKQGQAIFFASWLQHRVKQVTQGGRYSLGMWFGGPPFQ